MSTEGAVALIGGAGFIGRALAAELARRGRPALVVDVAPCVGGVRLDVSRADAVGPLAERLRAAGAASVVHLAARVDPAAGARERAAARRLHEDGTRHVVLAARAAGARRFVLVSSATVYGAWPENPVPLGEDAPVRPNAFAYAEDKATQERIVEQEAGGLAVAVARPAIVYGPGAKSYLTEIIRRAPVLPAIDGHRPPLQFVHVDDVARALAELALSDARGPFNVAPDDWLALDEVAAMARKPVLRVSARLLRPLLDAGARVAPPAWRAPAAMLPYLTWPFVVSSERLQSRTPWRPRHGSAAALRALL